MLTLKEQATPRTQTCLYSSLGELNYFYLWSTRTDKYNYLTVPLVLLACPSLKLWSVRATLFMDRLDPLRRRSAWPPKKVCGVILSHSLYLIAVQVIPVVGDPAEATTWSHMIATLDVVIDCTRSEDTTTLMQAVFKLVTDGASRLRPANAPKLTFISTSGTGPHGSSRTEFVTDTTPCTRPIPLAVGRVDLEQNIVKNSVINGIVIRPSLLYGRSGSLFDIMFSSAAKGKAEWYGTPGGRFALIHTDDLADLYLRAAEKAQLVGGMIFTAANDFTESVDDVLAKVTEVSGAKEAPEYFDTAGNRES